MQIVEETLYGLSGPLRTTTGSEKENIEECYYYFLLLLKSFRRYPELGFENSGKIGR